MPAMANSFGSMPLTPTPTVSRPPLRYSTDASACAVFTGLRRDAMRETGPIVTCCVSTASAPSTVRASRKGGWADSVRSGAQMCEKPAASA